MSACTLSTWFPVATAGYSVTRTRTGPLAVGSNTSVGAGSLGGGRGAIYRTQYAVPISATWDLDVWGRVRRQIEANTSGAQASAADLDNAKLSAQAQLAIAYFNLRAADSLIALFTSTIAEYKKTYEIVNNQYKAGFAVTLGDVATADAQIATTEAQLAAVRAQRAQFEHAIAILTGRPPAELGVGPRNLAQHIPNIPVTVPSALLERRPDIAAAERTMEEQNALIGVVARLRASAVALPGSCTSSISFLAALSGGAPNVPAVAVRIHRVPECGQEACGRPQDGMVAKASPCVVDFPRIHEEHPFSSSSACRRK